MATELRTSTSVTLNATRNAVWRTLTTPDQIRQWFFGVETRTDWQVGGPIVHSGEWQGQPYEDKGTIVEFDPPRKLVHTHWSPLSGLPDAPENYQVVAWELEGRDGATVLTVSEENLPSEQAKATSETAWATALENLRRLLESS
jgi:uncharacterized protein YndB with AHSA1/START domain